MTQRISVLLLIAMAFGVGLRTWNAFADPSLWLDEVFSAKLAESPLRDLLLTVPRFDTHPPLYYVQLHVWAWLGSGDTWLILNSVLLDSLVILSLAIAVRRIHGDAAGLWAAAVYAVMPLNVFFAENVRMYAQLFLLVVWLWYMLELRVRSGQASGRARAGTLLLGLAVTLTHGLGFFVAFFVYLQAVVRLWQRPRAAPGLRPVVGMCLDYAPVALASAYSLGIGLFRKTEGLASLDLDSIGVHLTIALFGMEFPFPVLGGYVGVLLLLVPPLVDRQSRGTILSLVILPIAVLLVLSLTVKTVFMYRTIGLFSPFLAISLGLFYAGAWRGRRAPVQVLSGLVLVLLAIAALNSSVSFRKEGYRGIAVIWDREATDGAAFIADGVINMWGVARYLPDTPGFSALDVQPPVREGMLRVKEKLEGTFLDRSGLFGKTDHLEIRGRTIWPYVDDAVLAGSTTYWVLSPVRGTCLRPQDRVLREYSATGKLLLECATPGAGQ